MFVRVAISFVIVLLEFSFIVIMCGGEKSVIVYLFSFDICCSHYIMLHILSVSRTIAVQIIIIPTSKHVLVFV